jgi:DNA-binding MarR family transcriptional regulator
MNENILIQVLHTWSGIFDRRTMRDFLAFTHEYGITMPQVNVLMRLYYRGDTTILSVRQELYGSRAAATQLIDKLVQMGLVERSEAPQDRRIKRIRLTALGHDTVEQGIAARRQWITQLAQALPPQDRQTYAEMLAHLSHIALELENQTASPGQPPDEEKE